MMDVRTPAQIDRRQGIVDASSGVYRSPACHIGEHAKCPDATSPDVERDTSPGVTYEPCACPCSHG